jgi:hypothetical protein
MRNLVNWSIHQISLVSLRFAIGKVARRNSGEILLSYLLILRYIDIKREGRHEIIIINNIIVYQQCNNTLT